MVLGVFCLPYVTSHPVSLIRDTCFIIQNMLSQPFVRVSHPRAQQTVSPKLGRTGHAEHLAKGLAQGGSHCLHPALWEAPSQGGPFTSEPILKTEVCFCLHLFKLQLIHSAVGIVCCVACFFLWMGRDSPFHGSLIHFVGPQLPCQISSFVVLIGLKSTVRCCVHASRVHLGHLLPFISMAPRPNSSSGSGFPPPHVHPAVLIAPVPILPYISTWSQGRDACCSSERSRHWGLEEMSPWEGGAC